MTQTKRHMFLWLVAGFLFSLLVFLVVWTGLSGQVWIADPEGIPKAADAVMNSIRTGNWTDLEEMIVGRPALTPTAGEADSAENRIWEAYRKSLQWTCSGEFVLQGSSVTQSILITCLDIPGVADAMAGVLANSDTSKLTTEEQAQILRAAAQQVLESEAPYIQHEITLAFQRIEGQWMLVPNNALLMLLSGFIAN